MPSSSPGSYRDQNQVRYLGLMENLRVRRAGYCHRQLYPLFVTRYKVWFGASF